MVFLMVQMVCGGGFLVIFMTSADILDGCYYVLWLVLHGLVDGPGLSIIMVQVYL